MLAIILTALLAASPGSDTVIAVDGTRIAGTVIEESPSAGVTIQLADGSFRHLEPGQIARVEFADGSVSVPGTPARPQAVPAPAAPPAPVSPPAPQGSPPAGRAGGPFDTIFFLGGGRVRGTVLEESPREGVTIRLLDGSVRTYPRSELVRIEYADGSVSRRRTPPRRSAAPPPREAAPQVPPPPSYAPAPAYPPPSYAPPAYAPVPYAAPYRHPGWRPPLSPVYGAFGVGATLFGGDAQDGVAMSRVFEPQANLSGELGVRLVPELALGVYGDVGAGDPASGVRQTCRLQGVDCVASSGHVGVLARFTFDAATPTSKWLSLGTGWEVGRVALDHYHGPQLFKYSGREWVRIGAGVDFRSSGVVGLGLYGQVGIGAYDRLNDATGAVSLLERTHTTVLLGVRLVLFP